METIVDANSLALKLNVAGLKSHGSPHAKNGKNMVADGVLDFSPVNNNLMVHTCDLIEASNTTSSTALNPSISINILLEGRISYQLGNQRYNFESDKNGPIIIVNIINQPEILTRFITKNHKVRKANIFCTKQWLTERCITETNLKLLQSLFNGSNKVIHWQAPQKTQALATRLLTQKTTTSLISVIEKERTALEILSIVMSKLCNQNKLETTLAYPILSNQTKESDLLDKVDQLLDQKLCLHDIAKALAMSISTLQRKFKFHYQVTVIEYQRQRKLNQSRTHLLVDGLTIGETAYLAGYKHPSNFNYAFKQHFKVTPTEFIQNHKRM